MQKTTVNHSATVAHRRAQASTTLNRRYVKRPVGTMIKKNSVKGTGVKVSIKRSPKIRRFSTSMGQQQMQKTMQQQRMGRQQVQKTMQMQKQTGGKQMQMQAEKQQMKMQYSRQQMQKTTQQQRMKIQVQETMKPAESHPVQKAAQTKMRERQMMMEKQQMQKERMSAKELKDQAIKKALMSAATTDMKEQKMTSSKKTKKTAGKMKFGFGRVMLALSCATAAVFAIAYFVNLNMPDISLRVAAMQTGINASYPGYVPRDYSIAGITSESGRVVLEFRHNNSDERFTLDEEASSWDSNALLTNYVKDAFGDEYTIIREQGLTIYTKGSNAAWVNGGIVYKLKAADGVLTNKQVRSIAVSL